MLYFLLRYTGALVSEATGIQYQDIDLKDGVLRIRPNELRPLKTAFRVRTLTMIPEPKEVLSEINITGRTPSAYVSPGFIRRSISVGVIVSTWQG